MDIYSSNSGNRLAWSKKLEHFFRTVFLISSSVFAVTMGLVLLDKSGTINRLTTWAAIPIVSAWFGSFVIWTILMIANSRIFRSSGSPSAQVISKKKKIGKIFLFVWLASLVSFGIEIFFISQPGASYSDILSYIVVANFFAIIILLPVWGFLLGNRLVKIIVAVPFALWAIFFVIYLFILRPHHASGSSMLPNYVSGEYFLSEKVSYYFSLPRRGDVVVFTPPTSSSMQFYARIVGLPGEDIAIRSGHVYINDKILYEPYLGAGVVTEEGPFIGSDNVLIPQGTYVILGDNRAHSNDSRYYGFVEKSAIEGRIFYIYWPRDKAGWIQ